MLPPLEAAVARRQSALLLGPRQVGKTTLMNALVEGHGNVLSFPLQDPGVRLEFERDPSLLGRRVAAAPPRPLVFIDEIQKVPEQGSSHTRLGTAASSSRPTVESIWKRKSGPRRSSGR